MADTPVPAAVGQDGKVYFSPRAICEGLGITWQGQHVKIMADPVLSSCVTEIVMQIGGQGRSVLMLPKEMAPGWLFTIKKVAPEVQAKG
ncbi:phage antirepressor N-terminal domain-containing protein [Novispirillum itersonii]|uniref:phage antirepressor N-terminal domain-containing protein n=1 Tax=Novispirillum itersonii TaxID=189 RepID=UPI0038990863